MNYPVTENDRTRSMALGLGAASMGISGLMSLAPNRFAELFGFSDGGGPREKEGFRAAGMRDMAVNAGLISAAQHKGNYRPWVMARAMTDAGDVGAVLLTALRGKANRKTYMFGAIAALHTILDLVVLRAARRAAPAA